MMRNVISGNFLCFYCPICANTNVYCEFILQMGMMSKHVNYAFVIVTLDVIQLGLFHYPTYTM